MTWLLTLFARLSIPQSLRTPLGQFACLAGVVAVLCLLAGLWLHFHDDGVADAAIEQHEAAISAQVEAKATAAAAVATMAAEHAQQEVERSNDEARAAAADSDDPLKSGLDRLRAGPPAHRAPTR